LLPSGAAAREPLPPSEADALLTRPNIAQTIQENEAAAAAAEAAKLAATAPTTVNVVLNNQSAAASESVSSQRGGGKPPTLEIFDVDASASDLAIQPDPVADGATTASDVKVLSVTAFDPQPKK
jgi:hypothetical protein